MDNRAGDNFPGPSEKEGTDKIRNAEVIIIRISYNKGQPGGCPLFV
jgi:hypothetical protein